VTLASKVGVVENNLVIFLFYYVTVVSCYLLLVQLSGWRKWSEIHIKKKNLVSAEAQLFNECVPQLCQLVDLLAGGDVDDADQAVLAAEEGRLFVGVETATDAVVGQGDHLALRVFGWAYKCYPENSLCELDSLNLRSS